MPADAVVTNATLNLTLGLDAAGTGTSQETIVRRVTSDWSSTITWADQPSTDSTYLMDDKSVGSPKAGDTVSYDPVELVQGWLRGQYPNFGLQLSTTDVDNATNGLVIRAKGFADTAHPTLVVDWHPQVGQKPSVAVL